MRILGWIGFLLLLCSTAAMAGAYAYQLGLTHGPDWANVAAAGVAALLVAESALAAGRGPCPPWLRVPALLLAMVAVFTLEVGFTSSITTDARAKRAADATAAEAASAIEEPAAVLRVHLEAHEGRNPGIRSTWCGSNNINLRDACTTWTDLRARLAAADAVEKRGPARAVGDADARSALFMRVLGGTQAAWADWLILLLAAAFSLTRVACAAMLLGDTATAIAPAVVLASVSPAQPANTGETLDVAPLEQAPVHVAQVEPSHPEPQPAKVEPIAPATRLPEPARRVLRVVAEHVVPPADGQGFTGFVPPGLLSQRALSSEAGLSRRQTTDGLDALQTAGMLEVTPHGHEGTAYRLLQPV